MNRKILIIVITNYYNFKCHNPASANRHNAFGFLERAAKNLPLNRKSFDTVPYIVSIEYI